jgi:hypothetical protein
MIFAGQPDKERRPTFALAVCGAASTLLFAALLYELGISPMPILLATGGAALLVVAFRHPLGSMGAFLAIMPFFTIAFLLVKFFGPSYVGKLEGIDRAVLLMLTCILWWRNGIKLILPDWFLIIGFGIALIRLPLDGTVLGLASDFGFVIAYAAGRVACLTQEQQASWARRAVRIVAVVSLLGLAEVFVLGPGPRTMLYLAVSEVATEGGTALNGSFRAVGFTGMRVSGTMYGPLQFGPLCMATLIIWWVYSRKPVLGGIIAAGMVGSLTRSAWVGTALAIPVLAVGTKQTKRFFLYATLALILFVASVPIFGLEDYLSATRAGDDPSAQGHQNQIFSGLEFMLRHPLGVGTANLGRQATKENPDAFYFESAYLTLAGAYGIPTLLCLLGFLLTVVRLSWRLRTKLGYVAAGVVVSFSAVMMVASLHDVFPLACWLWFPVGLAITATMKERPGIQPPFTPLLNRLGP